MRFHSRFLRWIVFGVFFCLPLSSSAVSPKTFTFRLLGDPETLDWNRAHTPIETFLMMNLMEGLVAVESSTQPIPALAESWKQSADQRTYTFKIRKGVRWSDGVFLQADDFAFSWQRLLTPSTAAAYAYLLFDIEGAEDFYKGKIKDFSKVGIKVLDPYTLQVRLNKPIAHWIYIPSFWVTFPMRKDIVSKAGEAWAKPGRMQTVGPFTLESYDFDSKIVLKANPHYYAKRGNIEKVVALIVKDDSTALSLYESGKFDVLTDLSIVDLNRLHSRSDLKTFPYLKTAYMGFVTDKYPISNVKVRRAISMAIDKSKIEGVLHGKQSAATTFVPPKISGHSPRLGLKYDPVQAKAELRSSGVDTTRPITIDLLIPNWDKTMTLAQFIQAEIKKNLNVTLNIISFDNKTFRAQLDLKSFPIFITSWSADYPDPDNFLSVFTSASGNNRTAWKSEKFDAQVVQARQGSSTSVRTKTYLEMQKQILENDVIILPLYYEPNLALVQKRVRGFEINPMNYIFLKKVNVE